MPSEVKSKCVQAFRTSNYEQFKDRNPERLDKTCEWFLRHPNFQKWKESKTSNILWVSADPGCGKSVLAKYLVDKEKCLEANKTRAVCYFFFKDDDESQKSNATALSAILHQLLTQRVDLISYAMKAYKVEGDKLPQLFEKLWGILLKAAEDSKAGEIVCILDGLDECPKTERYQFIKALVNFYKKSASQESKSRLKFLITSRPYLDIERQFTELNQQFPEIRLSGENESESISREIDMVIRSKLHNLSEALSLTAAEQSILEEELLSMPQRTYLWATLVFDILNAEVQPTRRKLKEIVGSIPPTVDDAYEKILSKIENKGQARKLFSIIVAATRPLTLSEMNVALTIDDTHDSYEDLKADLDNEVRFKSTVRLIGGLFISIKDERVFLIHQTARQFLLGQSEVLDHWKHSLDPVSTELIMTKSCINFLSFKEFDDGFDWDVGDDVPFDELFEYEYLGYASNSWMLHYQKAQAQGDVTLLQSVLKVCDKTSRRFNAWSRLFTLFRPSSPLRTLANTMMIASYFGHDTVVKELLMDGKEDINFKDRAFGRTSLLWAVEQGHREVVELLVDTANADVNTEDNADRTPLWLACNMHQEEIALFLLKNSADPMHKTARAQSALFESTVQGLANVVNYILQSLSDEQLRSLANQHDSRGNSILNLAVSDHGSQSRIVKMIIQALSRFPEEKRKLLYHQGYDSCSPLFNAALKNQPEVIQLLVKVDKELLNQTGWLDWEDTPLHVATHWQNLEAVQALLQGGANPDIQQRTGRTPLHIASERTDSASGVQILKSLLKRADPLICENDGRNILHIALQFDREIYFKIMKQVIPSAKFRQLLTSKNNRGNIPILHAANKLRSTGRGDPLLSAAFGAVCDAMVEIVTESDDNFVLDLVNESDRPMVLHHFVETNSDELMVKMTSKAVACDRSFLDTKDSSGRTLLMKAVDKKLRGTIQLLLQSSININAQDNNGKTALHHAVASDSPEMAEVLVQSNASLHIKDNYNRMPVDWCSSVNTCFSIVNPKDRPTTPNPIVATSSTRSSRSDWRMVLGAPKESCQWQLRGDRTWHPTSLREERYLISDEIPSNIKLPVSRIHVVVEGRDQGWSHPQYFGHLPDGSFTSHSTFALGILRNDQIILQREWARNKQRTTTLHTFDCTWYSDPGRNLQFAEFGGRRPVGEDDQGDFVRTLAVGDRVVLLALTDGAGWINIVKSASMEVFFED
ncbi:unnamed protein product [Penicillium salamii]|uniref:NACHT domain-containing protein n=1 Tax=Penicillium salamii TaxID=1612424 RepID=A0A9W4NHZ6_9EURO|nr:unnamed protein product [Penicillium salamii]CAG8008855.1 unnamed protein product [Penicillium salamii]CAG8023314.1 unnamed protein product [Penicillium salamii]CAG8118371.1 unnamed protein product [Penicillium salamii]CAG8144408.1 unnamed protein product [Penicillium salamii]